MKSIRGIVVSTAMILLAACIVTGQTWRRNNDDRPSSTRPRPQGQTVEEGQSRAPDSQSNLPANQEKIPAPTEPAGEPEPVKDGGFARAYAASAAGVVRIYLDKNRKAIGFLINGPDEDHNLVVTNFLSVAGANWIDVRGGIDGTKIRVKGLLNHDEKQDLAIILVKASDSRKVKPLTLSNRDPRKKETVYGFGLSNRNYPGWAGAGKVLGIAGGADIDGPPGSQWISTEGVVTANNRGGPLMSRDGRVVGLCASGGRLGRGPHLSVPVSKIRDLVGQDNFGPGRFPSPLGAFRWPEAKRKRPEVFSQSKIRAAIFGLKKTLDCKRCKGFGYLVTPQYRVDQATGRRTRLADKKEICPDCGGAGVVIKPSIQQLVSSMSKALLKPHKKIDEDELAKLRSLARESFDRAAVNRKLLADALTPAAKRLLEDADKNRGQAVTFVARVGPTHRFYGKQYQWLLPYDSSQWVMTTGADVRGARWTQPPPQNNPRRRRRWRQSQQRQRSSAYVLASGIIKGHTVISVNKKMYEAPLVEAADLAVLR
ncbi:MAG: hypothetical protein GWP05_03790 [Anaerolineaceae bacterium]|nr:hypothetical protein [Anaerolineaceae bacterium]